MLKRNENAEDGVETQVEERTSIVVVFARGLAQFGVMALVLFLGFFGMNFMISQKEPPPSRPPFQAVYTVDTVIAERGKHQPNLLVYGEVQASRDVELRSLVAGEVVEVNEKVKVGGTVEQGEELFRIDPFVFEQEKALAEANMAETAAKIDENQARIRIERSRIKSLAEQLKLAENDLARITSLRQNGTATEKQVEDRSLIVSQRRQSLEQAELNLLAEQSRLQQMEAVMERFRLNRVRAERNIADTVLKAPLDGVVNTKNIAVGRMINTNDVIVSMYQADRLEVRFTLTDQRFSRIQSDPVGISGRKVEVIWSVGGEDFTFPAVIDRIGARIASDRGGVEVIAIIESDVATTALRPGAFVEVIVPDQEFSDHFRVPETALYGNDIIYEVVEGRLIERKVRVKARDDEDIIFVADMENGAEIMVTRIAEISEGLRVRRPENSQNENSGNDTIAASKE